MKISLDWLSDYIDTGLSAEQIAETLSNMGLPCEGIEHLSDDAVIDVEVTSNRGDCLSYIGIARELAAATGKPLKIPQITLAESTKDVAQLASVEIREPDLCGRYTARVIEGVKVGPSPDWVVKRLEAVGLRSVNNVVDAGNYAMMETGQPPHTFDYDRLSQGRIIVRKAVAGERLVSIDGTQCELNPGMLIIADPNGPVAIAGVMGGLDTEVIAGTTRLLLEDAYFDPVSVRNTSRKLALPSESAFRFERIVDIEGVDWASKRTAQLITQLAGGKVLKGVVDAYPKKPSVKTIALRLSRLDKLLGVDVPPVGAVEILSRLGFQPQLSDTLITCTVPCWRSDVYREVDLIEEVARVHGYDKVPTKRKIEIEASAPDARNKLTESVGKYLNSCGFYETITVTFVDGAVAELFRVDAGKEHLSVKDVSRKSTNVLRQMLLGSLLGVLKTNVSVGNLPCRIFEMADVFIPTANRSKLPVEKTMLSLVADSDLRDLHGVIEGLVRSLNRQAQIEFVPAQLPWAQVGARVVVGDNAIGYTGVFSQTVRSHFDFKSITSCGAELEFAHLMAMRQGVVKAKPIPRYPAIVRDLSIVVDDQIRWADIAKAVEKAAPVELENIRFVGIYRGETIPPAKKSVTLSLRFRDQDGTLTHDVVDGFQASILNTLAESLGAELRSA